MFFLDMGSEIVYTSAMHFVSVEPGRYQVFEEKGGKLLGTVREECFTSYPHGKPIKRSFWVAFTRGYVKVAGRDESGRHETRRSAAESLIV